mmetsp:Transcript_1943/g.4350  ORF Transcript_1943/g.4350 Transcript_1943/m.4350 type:complete len:83 (+) Transcript_1943:1893-2141(+)|eukprot:757330-Hanusia_phi.AAC.1
MQVGHDWGEVVPREDENHGSEQQGMKHVEERASHAGTWTGYLQMQTETRPARHGSSPVGQNLEIAEEERLSEEGQERERRRS